MSGDGWFVQHRHTGRSVHTYRMLLTKAFIFVAAVLLVFSSSTSEKKDANSIRNHIIIDCKLHGVLCFADLRFATFFAMRDPRSKSLLTTSLEYGILSLS